MQLVARNKQHRMVGASQAQAGHDYFCPECWGVVRLRGGLHRRQHFFHLQRPASCRQAGKSMEHLQVQLYLENQIGENEVQLECSFPRIGRIADVCWPREKIIFEVQCSPITAQEVRQRNQNYASEGYQVVWIFHQSYFNQERVRAAEQEVWDSPHYFTDIKEGGEGVIYDQYSCIQRARRTTLPFRYVINPALPKRFSGNKLVSSLSNRREWLLSTGLYFAGDVNDQVFSGLVDQTFLARIRALGSTDFAEETQSVLVAVAVRLKKVYTAGLHAFLEVVSR